jgi:hypothetical protein
MVAAVVVCVLFLAVLVFAICALYKIGPQRFRFQLGLGRFVTMMLDMESGERAKNGHVSPERHMDTLSNMSHPTCYQPHGTGGVIVAHAVSNDNPSWSIAGEPLSGPITEEKWPGRGPACPWCEKAQRGERS